MELASYRALLDGQPELEHCLRELIGPESIHDDTHPNFTFQEWLEAQVNSIEVGHDGLSLNNKNVGTLLDAEYTQYVVFYRIESPDTPEIYGRRTAYQADGGASLMQTLGGLKTKHQVALADNPKSELVVDLVVRHSRLRAEGVGFYREELVLFPFDLACSRYWLNHCPPVEPPVSPFPPGSGTSSQ